MIPCRDWLPWRKHGYITMTKRQSNNQRSDGIAAQPARKHPECKNALENFSPPFFWIKAESSSLIIFQNAKQSTRHITHLCWCNWRTFWKKNAEWGAARWSCSCRKMSRFTGHLQSRKNWPTRSSNISITHPILLIRARRTTTCSLEWKKTIKISPFFGGRRINCCREDLGGRTTFYFFWVTYKS